MTIEKLLELVDSLSPNNCTESQKLYWYNQCESIICNKAMPRYRQIETYVLGGIVKLPDGYCSEDIEAVYVNGRLIDKLDFRSGFTFKQTAERKKISVILKENFGGVEKSTFEGDMFFNGDTIRMEGHPFVSGDKIDITSSVFTGRVTVLGTSGDTLYVNRVFDVNDCDGVAEKTLDIEVMARAPYDKLYIDYIIAQMDYYNKDYESYNNNSYMFNELLDEFVRRNAEKAPGTKSKKMRGIW